MVLALYITLSPILTLTLAKKIYFHLVMKKLGAEKLGNFPKSIHNEWKAGICIKSSYI